MTPSMQIDPKESPSKFMGTSEAIMSSIVGRIRMKLEAYTRIARKCIPMRIQGNHFCEVTEMQVSRVLAADDGEGEEDEDEERRPTIPCSRAVLASGRVQTAPPPALRKNDYRRR